MRSEIYFILLASCYLVHGGVIKTPEERCCAPDQFEADVKPVTLFRSRSEYLNDPDLKARFSYDYKNQRWAYEQQHASNSTHNLRLVHDYNRGYFYALGDDFCQRAKIPELVKFSRYCVQQNASYQGQYMYGAGNRQMAVDVWSYDFLGFPIRSITKITPKQCLPIQESGFGLVANTWQWFEGEKPCIPWKQPRRAESGDCYRSHVKLTRSKHSSQTTVQFFNYLFQNQHLGIQYEDMYEIPAECEDVEKWDKRVRLAELQNIMRYKMKTY